MLVYTQSEQVKWWLNQTTYTITEDNIWDVAIIEIIEYQDNDFANIMPFVNTGKPVLLFLQELTSTALIDKFDLPNVTIFIPGYLNYQTRDAVVKTYMYFFDSTIAFYKQFPRHLETKHGTNGFDALLGRKKYHRDLLKHYMGTSQNIVKYFKEYNNNDIAQLSDKEFVWPSILPQQSNIYQTVDEVTVDGVIVSLSQILPHDIYALTHSTVVAETQSDNEFSFFTEKIVKPILAKRPFVVASGQHYLKNLRKLGFKTFDGIINESYDQQPFLVNRMSDVASSILAVNQLDVDHYLAQCKPIVEHNFQLMFETDWVALIVSDIVDTIEN